MKKINFIILTLALIVVGLSSFAQIEWVTLPSPNGLCYTKKIEFKGDSIVLFGRTNLGLDVVCVTTDRGKKWDSFQTPTINPTGVWFKGNYYAFVQDGIDSTEIFCSRDLVNFEKVSVLQGFYVFFVSSGESLFAFGDYFGLFSHETKNWRSSNGISWEAMSIGNSHVLSYPVFAKNTIMALEYFGIPMSVLWISNDNGDTWSAEDTLLFNPGGADSWNGKFQWVGGSGVDTLHGGGTTEWQAAGYGDINFNGPRRIDLLSVQLFKGDWYMGGATFDNDTTGGWVNGVLMKNGNPDSVTYFGEADLAVYSDHKDRIILVENYATLWINKISAQGISENDKSKFQLYPNPTTGPVNIISSEKCEVGVYNMSGTSMAHFTLMKGINKIDLSEFPPGVYFIRLPYEEVKKIIKI